MTSSASVPPEFLYQLARQDRERERERSAAVSALYGEKTATEKILKLYRLLLLDDCLACAGTLVQQTAPQNKAEGRTQPFILPTLQGGIDYGPFQDVLQKILQATEKRTVCHIIYAPPGMPERTHEMAVTGLVSGKQALYLRGWKVADKGTPHAEHPLFLAVHRIKDVSFTCRTHDLTNPPEEVGFGLMAGELFRVRVQVSPGAAAYVRVLANSMAAHSACISVSSSLDKCGSGNNSGMSVCF